MPDRTLLDAQINFLLLVSSINDFMDSKLQSLQCSQLPDKYLEIIEDDY